jgi:hypothetical protein
MQQQRPGLVWLSGVMAVGAMLAGSLSSAAEFAGPVLVGAGGGAYCGPCEPAPLVTRALPETAVVALRYRWSLETRTFQLLSEEKVGVTDQQGELRFTVAQGEGSVDKVVVSAGGLISEGFVFQTRGACAGPRLCPGPAPIHTFTNAVSYLPGRPVVVTAIGGEPGHVVDVALEEYAGEDAWAPVALPVGATVDALGHAVASFKAPSIGVYRAIVRDRETGQESGFGLFEVNERFERR